MYSFWRCVNHLVILIQVKIIQNHFNKVINRIKIFSTTYHLTGKISFLAHYHKVIVCTIDIFYKIKAALYKTMN